MLIINDVDEGVFMVDCIIFLNFGLNVILGLEYMIELDWLWDKKVFNFDFKFKEVRMVIFNYFVDFGEVVKLEKKVEFILFDYKLMMFNSRFFLFFRRKKGWV